MGIRFACHACGKPLNIKNELAGKRGVCPECKIRFRIPMVDSATSEPLESDASNSGVVETAASVSDQPEPNAAAVADPTPVSNGSTPASEAPNQALNHSTATNSATSTANSRGDALAQSSVSNGEGPASWYVRPPSGGQFGPASEEVLQQWLMEGRIIAESLLWRPGWEQWRAAHEVLPGLTAAPSPNNAASAVVSPAPAQPAKQKAVPSSNGNASIRGSASIKGSSDLGSGRRRGQTKARNLVTTALLLVALALVAAIGWILAR
ncbi:MAG: GYF domain-containing protein [Planctomycetota bacterium]